MTFHLKKTAFYLQLLALTIFMTSPGHVIAANGVPESFADLVSDMGPTVVNVYSTKVLTSSRGRGFNPFHEEQEIPEFFKKFFDMPTPDQPQPKREQKAQSLGSGVIISADGYIVTNNHVIENAEEIKIRLTNHEEYDAEVIGRDPKTDVGLIKIKPKKDLPHITFGDSDTLRVGDWVVAIGNPFGFENTVTAGIVSGKGRSIGGGPYENFIQTDASINMGNSGGPLFNLKGMLVGINTAIFSRGGGNIGLGFAIPVNMVKNVVDQLKEHGKVTRGWLGVMIQHVTADLAEKFGLDRPIGALVGEVMKDSPADKAGVKQGDVITKFMGKEINQMSLLPSLVAQTDVGTEAELTIIRKGKEKKLTVKIGKLQEDDVDLASAGDESISNKLGLTVQEVTPEIAQSLGIKDEKGLLVSNVDPDSPAARSGIKRGEMILEINQEPVETVKEFKAIMEKVKSKDSILFLTKKDDHTRYVVIKNN
ncbi:MAG: DegQ family serine endoprotease [Proteobacteria bacterium]|nr:DegQ family serine endoprotease [Pseudomonadota bacterium]MBU1739561.1 DegQ family serine endoprotease [Pseudomonadota bacterium]